MKSKIGRLGLAAALLASAAATGVASPARAASTSAPLPATAARPNIVFILVDDMGWRDTSYGGSTYYETPAIDRLAKDGEVFTNAYAAYPRCAPSRFAIMSGKNPARDGNPGLTSDMPASEFTMAEALKAGGYATFFAGKWHIGKTPDAMPQAQGFDINIGGGSAGAPGSYFWPFNQGGKEGKNMGPGLEQGKPGDYLADRLTDETIKFIDQHEKADPKQPFFAYLSHYSVHVPFEAKQALIDHFKAKLAAEGGAKTDGYLMRDGQTKKYQDNAVYAAMIASVDQSVGRIRTELTKLGIADNTVIVFTSDNGGLSNRGADSKRELATSNLPLRGGKGHVYEGGIKEPLIVLWPGHTKPGSVTKELTDNTDHYPTMLQIAGLPQRPQQTLDGVSYAPVLEGGHMPADRVSYWYDSRPRPSQTGDTAASAIRIGNWKFIRRYDPKEVDELFDLGKDPDETTNLAKSDSQRADAMRQKLDSWLASINAVKPHLGRDDSPQKAQRRAARKAKRKAAGQDAGGDDDD